MMDQAKKKRVVKFAVLLVLVAGAITAGTLLYQAYYVGKFAAVVEGKLYRCRQPEGWHWSLLERHNIKMVINLRPHSEYDNYPWVLEEQISKCEAAGAEYVNIPVDPMPTAEQFEEFLRRVRGSEGAVIFHCEHGRTRTGIMAAAYRIVVQDWSIEQAKADMAKFDFSYRNKLESTNAFLNDFRDNRQAWLTRTDPAVPSTKAETQPTAVN